MKLFVCVALLIAAVNAGGYGYSSGQTKLYNTPELKKFVPIVRLVGQTDNAGNYAFHSESGDGTKQSETGSMKNINGHLGSVKSGQVSWTSPEGQFFTLSYTADEHGFQPTAGHLPVAPKLPEEVERTLHLLPKLEEVPYAPTPVRVHKTNYAYDYESAALPAPVSVPTVSMISINDDVVAAPEQILSAPAPVPLLMPKAPLKTQIKTPEFEIDSDMTRTFVKIGQ